MNSVTSFVLAPDSRGWLIAAVLAASLVLPGCEEKRVVSGYVLDDAIAGARVRIFDASTGEALGKGKSDRTGLYEIKTSQTDAYRVESDGGYLNGQAFAGELRTVCRKEQAAAHTETNRSFPTDEAEKNRGQINGRPWRDEEVIDEEVPAGCDLTPLTTLAVMAADADRRLDGLGAFDEAQANLREILGLPDEDPFVMDSRGETQTGVDLIRFRARIGNGSDLDVLLNDILVDIADGSLDGEARAYFPNARSGTSADPDELIERAQAVFNGDPTVPQTPDAELDALLAPSHAPAARARRQRLERNHDLVLHAIDPEPTWISTRASTQMLIVGPGERHSVDLVKLDGAGNVLGPVDVAKLGIELRIQHNETIVDYIPREYISDYVAWDTAVPGRLNIRVPADLERGRLLIGVRPDLNDAGQTAIAERWSVPILVDVWPLKPNVIALDEANVYYPLGGDAHFREGSAFDGLAVAEALQQASTDAVLAGQPLKALVVRGMNLLDGDLIDYRLPDPTGGIYPYGGRVMKVIAGADGQQMVLLSFEILAVYDVLLGTDDQFIKEGVLPEFVTYRSGEALPGVGSDPTLTYFGPQERATIQQAFNLFDVNCTAGSTAFAVTPYFRFDTEKGVDAGIEYSVGANGAKVECMLYAQPGADIVIPFGGPIGLLLQKLVGTGVTIGPYGEIKFSLDAGSGFTDFRMAGGYSSANGPNPPQLKWNGSLGSGLDASPIRAKATLGGEVGARAQLSAINLSIPFLGNYDLSLQGSLGWYAGFFGEAINAAAAKGGDNSALGTEFGPKLTVKASDGLIVLLKWLGGKGEFKAEYVATATKKITAGYRLGDVYDDGQGKAFAVIQPGGELIRTLTTGNGSGDGYASLAGSTVYNDPNKAISYDPSECQANGGSITTPLVGCIGGFFCGQVNEPAKLCGGQVFVTPVFASGEQGDTVSTQGTVGIRPNADPAAPAVTVTLSGDPLSPSPTTFQLNPGHSELFTASATCPSRGVHNGTITASAGSDSIKTASNVLSCACEPGTTDCDRVWGDPYLLTADGLAYDYIASGDYILQQVVDEAGVAIDGLEVQARFLPGFDVSWPYAVALRVGDDVVEITPAILGHDKYSIGMEVKINGAYVYEPASGGTGGSWEALLDRRLVTLPGGGLIVVDAFVQQYYTYKPRILTVIWPGDGPFAGFGLQVSMPDGQFASPEPFMSLQFIRPETFAGRERGMMGNNDGDPSNDFIRRNGEVLGQDSAMSWTALYGLFGGDWLVKPQECLFGDGCLKPDFPTSAAVLTAEQRALGQAACANLTGFYQEACIHDVGLTGSVELVQAFYANTSDLNWMATRLTTPGVDLAEYTLTRGAREGLPEGTPEYPAYRLGASVGHVSGEGKFLLSIRPPRGASAAFAPGQPGALNGYLTSQGDLTTALDVHCSQPDADWAMLGEAWPAAGALQLWNVDPLSGFASRMLGEIPLYCTKAPERPVLAASDYHSLALDDTGRLWTWGYNAAGLGDGVHRTSYAPVAVNLDALEGMHVLMSEAGSNHSLALDDAGRVWAWGGNGWGQLGDGTTTSRATPVAVNGALAGRYVTSLAAGLVSSFALDEGGRVWAWGANNLGQLGDGTNVERSSPVAVDLSALGNTPVAMVTTYYGHTLALDAAGQLWAWGDNSKGQLGDGNYGGYSRLTPGAVQLGALGGTAVVSMAAGYWHSTALDEDGRLWAWGFNGYGQLGDGSTTLRPEPVAVDLSSLAGAKVVSVAAGEIHTVALDETGRLWAWGDNYFGQLGDGTTLRKNSPVAVDLSALGDARVVSVTAGQSHTLALDETGRLWAWGRNDRGQLGDGTNTNHTTPVLVGALYGGRVELLSSDILATVALPAGRDTLLGHLRVTNPRFGDSTLLVADSGFSLGVSGQISAVAPPGESSHVLYASCHTPGVRQAMTYQVLGDSGNLVYSGVVDVTCTADIRQRVLSDADGALSLRFTNTGVTSASLRFIPAPGITLSGAAEWEGSLAQQDQEMFALTGVSCPFNGASELGILVFLDSQGQVYGQKTITALGAMCGTRRLAEGWWHNLALDETGRLWGWGWNAYGQLGDGTTTNRATPAVVDLSALGGLGITSVAAGGYHSLVMDEAGGLWSWGTNYAGQLGDGTTTEHIAPAPVHLDMLGDARAISVSVGHVHNVLIDDNGGLWAWGDNYYGELGDGTTTNRTLPVPVDLSALGNVAVVAVAADYGHTVALDEAGRVWAWGDNGDGQLGDGTNTNRTTPVAVDLSALRGRRVVSVAAGFEHTVALDEAGALWSWGNNSSCELGDRTTTNRNTPVAVDLSAFGGTVITDITVGWGHTLALDEAGRLWAFGTNNLGELGDGTTTRRCSPVAVNLSALGNVRVVAITAGVDSSLVLDETGRLWAWGANSQSQLGDGTSIKRLTPVLVDTAALGGISWAH